MRTHAHDRVRIPIRKWEKVATKWNGAPVTASDELWDPYSIDDTYRLEVVINGYTLGCDVRVPREMSGPVDNSKLREYIVASLSRQIGAVIADEVQRSIV